MIQHEESVIENVVRLKKTTNLTWREISKEVGLTKDQVRGIFRRNKDRYTFGSHKDEKKETDWYYDKRYIYNADNDVYVTFLSSSPKPIAIPGDVHRAMLQAYSNWDGQPATINQICRQFGMPRPWLNEYRQIHGWTHDHEPFTAEEVIERDVDSLVDDALQMRRQALHLKYEKEKWRETKLAAQKWWRFDYEVMQPMLSMLEGWGSSYKVTRPTRAKKSKGNMAILSTFCDLHYGKYAPEEYNRLIARQRVKSSINNITPLITDYADEVLLIIGSDDEHIDNYANSTTAGTLQDVDGTPAQIVIEYGQLLIESIDKLRACCQKVNVILVPGNHNRHTAILRGQMISAWYRNCDDVNCMVDWQYRKYMMWGDTLLGFSHGDGEKQRDIASIMATEVPEMWGKAKHRLWIVGHLHHQEMKDLYGMRVVRTPTLSGKCRWENRKGFNGGEVETAVYLVNRANGLISTFNFGSV